jgi:hypothetical protein
MIQVIRMIEQVQRPRSGEHELIQAILMQAIYDARGYYLPPSERRWIHKEVVAWFESYDYSPFSFAWTCDELGLDASAVRRQLFCCNCAERDGRRRRSLSSHAGRPMAMGG